MLPIPSTIRRLHRNAAPKNLVQGKEKNEKKEKWKWKKAPCISVSSNEGLVFLCLTPCDWYAKLATTPPQKQCKTETDCD